MVIRDALVRCQLCRGRLGQLHYQGLRSGYQGWHNFKVRGHLLLLLVTTIRHGGRGGGEPQAPAVWHSESFLTIDNGYQRKAQSPQLTGGTSCCRLLCPFLGAHLRENRSLLLNWSLLEGRAHISLFSLLSTIPWLKCGSDLPVQEQQRKKTPLYQCPCFSSP